MFFIAILQQTYKSRQKLESNQIASGTVVGKCNIGASNA